VKKDSSKNNFFLLTAICLIRIFAYFIFASILVTIIAIILSIFFVYFKPNLPYFDISFLRTIPSPFLEILFISIALLLILPLILFLNLANNLMSWQFKFDIKKIFKPLTFWLVSLVSFFSVSFFFYPKYSQKLAEAVVKIQLKDRIDENFSQKIKIEKLDSVDISAVKIVTVKAGSRNEIKIVGHPAVVEELDFYNADSSFTLIGKEESIPFCRQNCPVYTSPVRVEIIASNLKNLKLSRNIDAWLTGSFPGIILDISQKTGLKLESAQDQLNANISGESVLNSVTLLSNQVNLNLQNSIASIWAKKITLNGDQNSRLIYRGNPQIIKNSQNKVQIVQYHFVEDYRNFNPESDNLLKNYIRLAVEIDNQYHDAFVLAANRNRSNYLYLIWLVETKQGELQIKRTLRLPGNWTSQATLYREGNHLIVSDFPFNDTSQVRYSIDRPHDSLTPLGGI